MDVLYFLGVVERDVSVSSWMSAENRHTSSLRETSDSLLFSPPSQAFPKTARLTKGRDFRFNDHKVCLTRHFKWVLGAEGKGRLGVSISKKVLRNAVARNRIRRLLRESFRLNRDEFLGWDVHAIGRGALTETWKDFGRADVEHELFHALKRVVHEQNQNG